MFSFCTIKRKLNSLILIPIILASALILLAPNPAFAESLNPSQTTLITSEEVGALEGEGPTKWEQQAGAIEMADELDDSWRQDIQDSADPDSTISIQTAQVDPDSSNPLEFKFNDPTSGTGSQVTVMAELRDMTNLEDQSDLGRLATTQPEPDIGTSGTGANTYDKNTLQDLAPIPARFKDQHFINEQKAGGRTSRNAILFNFSEPLQAFGVFLGDVETRTDGFGTPAVIRLFDASGAFLSEEQLQPNHPNTSGDLDQSGCSTPNSGSAWVNITGCGHNTTRYVGFISPLNLISKMLIIVGDDDNYGGTSDDGNTEHLSFIGPTVAFFSPKPKEVKPPVGPQEGPEPGLSATSAEASKNTTSAMSSVKLASAPVTPARVLSVSSVELASTGSNSQLLVVLGLSLVLISASSVILIKLTKLN
jgi:LPXTG-motif cell wall-anchored protein